MRPTLRDAVTDFVVRARLRHAFDVLRWLPVNQWPQGFRAMYGVTCADAGSERRLQEPVRPTTADITLAEEALEWLVHLRHEPERVRRAVQMHAAGSSLRQIAPRLGCSHVLVQRLEARGIAAILAALKGKRLLPDLSTWAA